MEADVPPEPFRSDGGWGFLFPFKPGRQTGIIHGEVRTLHVITAAGPKGLIMQRESGGRATTTSFFAHTAAASRRVNGAAVGGEYVLPSDRGSCSHAANCGTISGRGGGGGGSGGSGGGRKGAACCIGWPRRAGHYCAGAPAALSQEQRLPSDAEAQGGLTPSRGDVATHVPLDSYKEGLMIIVLLKGAGS